VKIIKISKLLKIINIKMEIHPIAISSTTSENNMNQIQEEKESKKRIEHPTFILSTNKKYKNLVHCYLCKIDDCQKLFKTNQELIEHRKTHTQLHICPMEGCGKSFKEIINLRKHYKHHFPTEKRYYCPFEGCGKSFTASYNLTIHYRIHIGKQPYKCQKCGKCFFDRANYKYHLTSKHININSKKLICQHKNCEHKSKSIKQKLMHHDKLEEFCLQEKNLLINLVMFFQKSTFCLLNETDNKNEGNKNIVYNNLNENNLEDKKILNEIKKYNLDADLKDDFDKILIQSKVVSNNAINPDQYQDLI
jgi:uncharacterized Zn-finger protein